MSDDDESKTLTEQMGAEDWALIIGPDGNLKGMFIPDGSDEDEVPESIVHIMENYFGMSLTDDDEDDFPEPFSETVH